MSRIKIKGLGWIEGVPRKTAEQILKKWAALKEANSRLYEHGLKFEEWAGSYADLSQIDLAENRGNDKHGDAQKEENMKYYAEMDQQYRDYKKQKLAEPPAVRAKNLTIPNIIWWAFTGEKELPKELRPEVIKRQEAFFQENPGSMYANPICYEEFIKIKRDMKQGKEYQNPEPSLVSGALRMVERLVMADNSTKV